MDTLYSVATIASFIVSGAVVALNGIAAFTKNTKDDKVRDFFVFLHDKILPVLLPFLAMRVSHAEDAAGVAPAALEKK
jgi:uncharacterized membrane protein HdeD (DUF308 family)